MHSSICPIYMSGQNFSRFSSSAFSKVLKNVTMACFVYKYFFFHINCLCFASQDTAYTETIRPTVPLTFNSSYLTQKRPRKYTKSAKSHLKNNIQNARTFFRNFFRSNITYKYFGIFVV